MPTAKKRINVSISRDIERAIGKLAKRDEMPEATKAEHLLRLALEIEEDEVFDTIASQRDVPEARFVSHDRAWK
jgi:hypothetical protein